MKEERFSNTQYGRRKKKMRQKGFLEIIRRIILRNEWMPPIMPYCLAGKRGWPPDKKGGERHRAGAGYREPELR